jgi:CHAT domain-containing protein
MGEILSGDDVVSLENAFIFAGSPAVIATLWKVADQSTAELMDIFYQNLQKGMRKAEALIDAQRKIKEKYKNPFFWAPFTLRGDWR